MRVLYKCVRRAIIISILLLMAEIVCGLKTKILQLGILKNLSREHFQSSIL